MAYFAALLARSADRWLARDADLDEIEDVAGLVEFMRDVPEEQEDEADTAVLLLEQEDVWFAVVRLDAEEDPRLFVSDMAAVARSAYADLLLSSGLEPLGPDGRPAEQDAAAMGASANGGAPATGAADDEDEGGGDGEADAPVRPDLADLAENEAGRRPTHNGPAGDAELLADFGVRASNLVGLCGKNLVPADALADLAEALGAADELEEVR